MATPSSVFVELASTTINEHKKQIADNVSQQNALYQFIRRRGNQVIEDGGNSIVTPLDYAENGTYQRFTDWDTLDISQSDVITSAQYDWRQIAINVVASGRELLINNGKNQFIRLVKARMENAMRTFANNFSSDLYSAGTLANQINGLQAVVADSGTGTVGGINAGTWDFWQNKVFNLTTESVTIGSGTIENSVLLPLYMQLDRGPMDSPDLIIFSNDYYQFYEASQTSLKRYAKASSADGGFGNLLYKGAECMYDYNSGIPDNRIYMLNTTYLKLHVHKYANLTEDKERVPVNQHGVVMPIFWMGNLVCTNRAQQGVVIPS